MTQDTAPDMKDVELNELDLEKVPMAAVAGDSPVGGGEKNGVVKVKLEDEDYELEPDRNRKFTGLSKDELLKVAGTPGWVRVRWALLILFWLGWIGMLAGAVVIIVQAPRCRPLPVMEWWDKGPIYQIGSPETFQDSDGDGIGDIQGIQDRLESLSSLKVKGVLIGPLHVTKENIVADTELTRIDPKYGTEDHLSQLIAAAHKKSIQIILDLTPNYLGANVWFTEANDEVQTKFKEAVNYWLDKGAGGIYFSGIEDLQDQTVFLEELRNITSDRSTGEKTRMLLTSTEKTDLKHILTLLNKTEVVVLSPRYLVTNASSEETSLGNRIRLFKEEAEHQWSSWAIGGPQVGHMASLVQEDLLQVFQLLLFTLKGTPFTQYGDEIGLQDLSVPPASSLRPFMQWDDSMSYGFSSKALPQSSPVNANITFKSQENDVNSLLTKYKRLSELRGKERALLHGDFHILHNQNQALAFLRSWDQNERFVSALNFDPDSEKDMSLLGHDLPEKCSVVLSSDPQRKEGSSVSLTQLKLAPGEALLLKYPYSG